MAGLMQHANTQEVAQYAQQLNWEKTEVVRERADKLSSVMDVFLAHSKRTLSEVCAWFEAARLGNVAEQQQITFRPYQKHVGCLGKC